VITQQAVLSLAVVDDPGQLAVGRIGQERPDYPTSFATVIVDSPKVEEARGAR